MSAFRPALILLATCMLINYIDRGNLSTAAPLLKDELGISAGQLGILLSAFFWSYTAMQFVSGWLIDRIGANRLIAAGYLLWSLATATTGILRGFTLLLSMRLLLGIGESIALPSCSKLLASYLPEHHRGFANGLIASSFRTGNALGTLGGGLAMALYGWRPVFIVFGVLSLLWLLAWAKWQPRGVVAAAPDNAHMPSVFDIMRQRSFWGTSAGHFSGNYLLYFMTTWLPFYLVRGRHLSMQTMAGIAALYYTVDALSAVLTGLISDSLLRRGATPTLVRKSAAAGGCIVGAVAMSGCATAATGTYVFWLLGAGVGSGMVGSVMFAFSQTLGGPQAAGKWAGLQNGFANFAGVVCPAVAGFAVEKTGGFVAPFVITAALLLAGAFAWAFIVGPVEQVHWQRRAPAEAVGA